MPTATIIVSTCARLGVGALLLGAAFAQVPARTAVATGGYVYDQQTRQPVAGADVCLVRRAYPGLPQSLHRYMPVRVPACPATKTDERGRFSFQVPLGQTVAFFAHRADRMALVSNAVVAGGFVTMDLRETREVSGTLRLRGDGKPVRGQDVLVYVPAAGDPVFGMRLATKTDAAGRYRAHVPLGTWVRIEVHVAWSWVSRDVHADAVNDFEIGGGPRSHLGRIVDDKGAPISGCVVISHAAPQLQATTNAAGEFRLGRGGQIDYVHVFPPDHHAVLLRYRREADIGRVPKMEGGPLIVRLVDREGRPHRRAAVVVAAISRQAATRARTAQHVIPRRYWTDNDGRVELLCPVKCKYLAAFVELEGRFVWFFRGAPATGGDVGSILVAASSRLSGQLVGPNRQPLPAVDVHLARIPDDGSSILPPELYTPITNLPLSLRCRSGNGGRFHFAGLQPGRYRVVVRAPNCFPFSETVVIGGGDQILTVALPKGRVLRGRVIGPDGKPLANIGVYAYPGGNSAPAKRRLHTELFRWLSVRFGGIVVRAQSDRNGRFCFYGMPKSRLGVGTNGSAKWRGTTVAIREYAANESITMRLKSKL